MPIRKEMGLSTGNANFYRGNISVAKLVTKSLNQARFLRFDARL